MDSFKNKIMENILSWKFENVKKESNHEDYTIVKLKTDKGDHWFKLDNARHLVQDLDDVAN